MTTFPLACTTRNQRIEGIYHGAIAIVDADGLLLHSIGDPDYPGYLRSSIKMVQAIPIVETGAVEQFGLTDAELAICCASHTGAEYHVRTVRGMLEKLGLGEGALRCGGHLPEDREMRERLIRLEATPTAIYNNCSGKHVGMLASCLAAGWPIETYLDPAHPLQQRILELIAGYSGMERADIGLGIDGCSLPTYYLPLQRSAQIAARFMEEALIEGSPAQRLFKAITLFPEMVQSREGFDSILMETLEGRCYAKRGAMGIMLVGLHTENKSIGIAVKMADGDGRPIPVVITHLLMELNLISPDEREQLQRFHIQPLTNWNGIVIGEMRPADHTITEEKGS